MVDWLPCIKWRHNHRTTTVGFRIHVFFLQKIWPLIFKNHHHKSPLFWNSSTHGSELTYYTPPIVINTWLHQKPPSHYWFFINQSSKIYSASVVQFYVSSILRNYVWKVRKSMNHCEQSYVTVAFRKKVTLHSKNNVTVLVRDK